MGTTNTTGARGDRLLDQLADQRDARTLRAMWLADSAELATRLAPRLARAQKPGLTDLLIDEVLAPKLGDDVAQAVRAALSTSPRPFASAAAAERVVERLRAEPASPPSRYQQHEPDKVLGVWVMEQPGRAVDQYADDVICDPATPTSDALVGAASERASRDDGLATSVGRRLLGRLRTEPDRPTLRRASMFLGRVVPSGRLGRDLVAALLAAAPRHMRADDEIPKSITAAAVEPLRELFGDAAMNESPGSIALLQLVDALPDGDRAELTALVVARHPALISHVAGQSRRWSDDEWKVRLTGLAGLRRRSVPAASILVERAPGTVMAELLAAFAALGIDTDGAIAQLAQKLSPRLDAAADARAVADAVWWPPPDDREGLQLVARVLQSATSRERRPEVVVAGIVEGKLDSGAAHTLLGDADSAALFDFVETEPHLAVLARELYRERPEEVARGARTRQQKHFRVALAEGLAEANPAIAFAGADAAYATLDETSRERLLELLEAHGTWEEKGALEAFANDTLRSRRDLRRRALVRLAETAPVDADLPPSLAAAIDSSDDAVLAVAFDAVRRLAPRDTNVVRKLAAIARREGPRQRPAADVLDALVTRYATALRGALNTGDRQGVLELLGATGRASGLGPLDHVGPDAEDDDVGIRRAAAAAVVESVRDQRDLDPTIVERIGALLAGDGQEQDGIARERLDEALAVASLGENAALLVLYDLIGFRPRGDAEGLYGTRTRRVVRQLQLYKKQADRGVDGKRYAITHLDLVAEQLAQAAYLLVGDSDAIKGQLARDERVDFGGLLQAFGGRLTRAKGPLQALHDTRSNLTEVPHVGDESADTTTWNAAADNFKRGAKILVGILEVGLKATDASAAPGASVIVSQ